MVASSRFWLAAVVSLIAARASAQPAERWECDAVRSTMIRLARPYLTAEQRVLYAMGVDKRGSLGAFMCTLTKPEAKCVFGAKSYGEARRCQSQPVMEIPAVPPDRADDPVDASHGPPFPPKEDLSALAGAATFEVVIEDSSDSAKASAKLAARLATILGPVKLKPAKKGAPADVTFRFVLRGTGVGLPYENLDTKKVRTQYTAGVLQGTVTVSVGGQELATSKFDVEHAPLSFDYKTKRFDNPADAPFAELFEGHDGPLTRLLDWILVSRGPDAHFALIVAKKQAGMLDYYATRRIETPPAVIEDALRRALGDKRAAVREAAQKGVAFLEKVKQR
jgi:hypothetical protein